MSGGVFCILFEVNNSIGEEVTGMDLIHDSQEQENEQEQEKAMEAIRHKLALLPDLPGCYLMKNKEGTIIYVGKAKVLKNRVRSYFTGSHDGKTQRLVLDIRDFEYIVTGSNMEALILECNLIKTHHPRYNVLLKDDKTFPYIKITNEEHPRLEVTRRVLKDKGNISDLIRIVMQLNKQKTIGSDVSTAQM